MTVRIDPDGSVTEVPGKALDCGHDAFGHCTVVHCTCPLLPEHRLWVGIVDDFGAQDQPLNRKAWALYGRSPIYGTMFLGRDDGGSITPALIAVLAEPLEHWPVPDTALAILNGPEPDRPAMLVRREDAQ